MVTALQSRPLDASKPISTVEELRTHLYHAAQLEMSTIPLYLYSAYSIQTQSYSQWTPGMSAVRTIRSVVIEEMLHLCLVRNLMIAIGGADELHFCDGDFVPTYPSPMLHRIPTLMLSLEPASRKQMQETFMPLELPEATDAPPEPGQYRTIGQFYAAITDGFERLSGPALWASNQPDLQYQSTYWNADGGGSPILVCDLPSALQAIATIVEQGEGATPGKDWVPISVTDPVAGATELSHYAKFRQIAEHI
ncbi:MAG TPA: ferritin-like protein, partial [Actinomycetota bacterium]|nr:ferritin-like protein [Actinomycetota bacterium]